MKNCKKVIAILLAITLSLLMLSACGKSSSKSPSKAAEATATTTAKSGTSSDNKTVYPFKYKDSTGTEVVFEKAPERAISISPSITEVMYALGMEEELAARTQWCDYPAEALEKTSIGDMIELDYELIADISPDVILLSGMTFPDTITRLRELGFKTVLISTEQGFDATYKLIGDLGDIFDVRDKAVEVINDMKEKVQKVTEAVKDREKPTVYYMVSFGKDGDYTATGDTFISNMVEMAGGDNIAASETGWKYSLEKLIEKDPYYIICSGEYSHKEGILATDGYKELTAAKEGRLIEVDTDLFEIQGPRLADGLALLAKIFHNVEVSD